MQRKPSPALTRKRRIGVLLDSVETIYQRDLLRGLSEGAANAGVGLWCFLGGCLPTAGKAVDAQHLIYDLAGKMNSDALIVCGNTFMHQVGIAGLRAHCERYRPLPLCSIGVDLPGHTSLLVDNRNGMQRMVDHLITVHGLRRIAFIRGPAGNEEADHRMDAYRQALADHDIPFDEQLVATGDFLEAGGNQAIHHFSRVLGAHFAKLEAVVASNDNMAIGALGALSEREIAVPTDIKVTGFDDIEEASLTQPQLSTIRQPLVKQGNMAVRLLLEQLQSGTAQPSSCLQTELVTRRSCGCDGSRRGVQYSEPPAGHFGFEAGVVFRRERIIDGMTRAARGSFGAAGEDWQGRLLNALLLDVRTDHPEAFGRAVWDLLEKVAARGVDLDTCRNVFETLREKLIPALRSDQAARDRAENLLRDAGLAISDIVIRHARRQRLRLAYSARMAANACSALSLCFDRAKLLEAFHEWLPRAGVRAAVIVLYCQDSPHAAELLCGYDEQRRRLSFSSRFDRHLIVPAEYDMARVGGCHFVMPLFVEQHLYGHVVLQFDIESGYAFRALATALACAVHGTRLKESLSKTVALGNAAER